LGAAAFAGNVDRFIGIDLSPGMIEKARASGLYAELEVADMVAGLANKPDASADFVLAADAMVYVADIAPVLAQVHRVLVPGGLFAFTTETHPGEGVILGEGLRYAFAAAHVLAALSAAKLGLALLQEASPRDENNAPVSGLVVVASKP
jgi:predicted TPR repeat methyltransferase